MSEKTSPPPPYYPPNEEPPKNEGYPPQAPPYGGQPTAPGGYPQQPGYIPVAQQASTVVVAGAGPPMGSRPCQAFCPKCQENIITHCDYDSSAMAWIICIILFVLGFCVLIPWFVCWIPFCIDGMKNTIHRCPKCRTFLGTYKGAGI